MSDIYYVDIQDLVKKCEEIFFLLVDKYYQPVKGLDEMLAKTENEEKKQSIHKYIGQLCRAIEHRTELLLYIKQNIGSFDWDKYHRFESNKIDIKSGDKVVRQVLQEGKMIVDFKYKETMDNFIFINLMTFFSIICSIIDNLAIVLKLAFNLQIPGNVVVTIVRVENEMPDGILKRHIHESIIKDQDFKGILAVRKFCEHRDHSQIFRFSDGQRSEAIGSRTSGVPLIKKDLVNIEDPAKRQINNYCEFAYGKVYTFLKLFLTTIITSVDELLKEEPI